MTTRRAAACAYMLSLFVGSTAADLSAAVWSAQAMACCVKAHHDCAGLQAPDDCCKTLRHSTAPPSLSAGEHVAIDLPQPIDIVAAPRFTPLLFASAATTPRLHDPPHLHTFTPLI